MDLDWPLRLAAFAALQKLRDAGGGLIAGGRLADGFEFEGEHIRFFDVRRGIWRPRQLGSDGAALTVVTTPPKPGKKLPYDDQITDYMESAAGRAKRRSRKQRVLAERANRADPLELGASLAQAYNGLGDKVGFTSPPRADL